MIDSTLDKQTSQNKILFTTNLISKIKEENAQLIGICGIAGSGKSTIAERIASQVPNCAVIPMDGFHLQRKQLNQEQLRRRGAPFTFDLKKFQIKMLQLAYALKQVNKINHSVKLQQEQSSKQNNKDVDEVKVIMFPSFNHQKKDPIQNDIKIDLRKIKHIIVQGLYIFDKNLLNLNNNKQIKVEKEKEEKEENENENIKQKHNNENNKIIKQFKWDLKIFIDEKMQICLPRVIKRCIQKKIQQTQEKAIQRALNSDKVNGEYVLANSNFEDCFFLKNPNPDI